MSHKPTVGGKPRLSNRMVAITIVALFLFSGLASVVLATHANEILPGLRDLLGGNPTTGQGAVDDAAGDAFDEYETLRAEPQVPANYFYSSAGDDLRIGGFGDWRFLLGDGMQLFREPMAREDWQETSAYAAVGDFSFSFGNEANGEYRTETINAYYVSPMIDLSSFVLTTEQEDIGTVDPVSQVGSNAESAQDAFLANRLTQAEQIKLRFQHKFNLAFQNDGGRVEVFTKQPAPGVLASPAAVLQPSPTDVSTAPMRPTRAYNGVSEPTNVAFTGQQGQWQTAEFDLTEFAGQQVFLAFRVATQISAVERERYFEIGQYFPPSNPLDFFGWKVDAVQVEGPAHHTNIRVRAIEDPFYIDQGAGELLSPAGSGPLRGDRSVFQVLVENRGSVTEEGYQVTFEVSGPVGTIGCENNGVATGPPLRPGGHASVSIRCDPLKAEAEYTLGAAVKSGRTVPDGDPADNSETASFRARTVLRLPLEQALTVAPAIGEGQDVRVIDFRARNSGNDAFLLDLGLAVVDSTGAPALVPAYEQPPAAIPVPVDEVIEWSWNVQLPLPGTYTLQVEAKTTSGHVLFQQSLGASTLVGSGDVFFDNHTGNPQGSIVGDPNWLTVNRWTPDPASATDGAYWDLAADEDHIQYHSGIGAFITGYYEAARVASLTGIPEADSDLAASSFDELVITLRHHINARCGGGWNGFTGDERCRDPNSPATNGAQPSSSSSFAPERTGLGTYEVWIHFPRAAADLGAFGQVTNLEPSADVQSVLLQKMRSIEPVRDRGRFYASQWVEEEYRLLPGDIDGNLESIPGSLVAALEVEARAEYGSCYFEWAYIRPSSERADPHPGCPNWQIDELAARAVSHDAPAASVRFLHTTGDTDTEQGTWISSMRFSALRYANRGSSSSECPTTTPGAPEFTTDAAFGCPVWTRRAAEPAAPSQWNLHQESFLRGAPAWWVGPEAVDLDIDYHYPDEAMDLLVSPIIEIPPGLDDASLKFFHKFRFRGEADYGAVFVQFMSDGEPRPISPFYQLVVQDGVYDHQVPPNEHMAQSSPVSQAFRGNSCGWYQPPVCDNNLAARELHEQSIALEPIRFLNFTYVNERTANLTSDWVEDDQTAQDIDSWRTDVLAYENGERSLKETGGRLRFAFAHYSTEYQENPFAPDGWFLGPVIVTGDNTPAHDVAITSLELDVPYPADQVGLGPDTTVDLDVTVANQGIFSQPAVTLEVVFTNAEDHTRHTTTFSTPEGFVLKAGEATTITVPAKVPGQPGSYHMMVRAVLPERLDNLLTNNCRDFDLGRLQNGSNENCDSRQGPAAVVRRHVDVGIQAAIVPLAGRVDDPSRGIFFPRTTLVRVSNSGNVPVESLDVRRAVQKIVPPSNLEPVGSRSWVLPEAIPPGADAAFEELTRTLVSGNPNEDDLSLSFDAPARYLVGFEASHPDDADTNDNQALILVEAWELFYSNNFEPGGEDRSLVTYDDWTVGGTHGEGWQTTQATSFVDDLGRGRTSYWFGDFGKGDYPDGASAWLEMPKMDLSNASLAFLNFRTSYDLEARYDGGLVEASVDDGDTWFPLRPSPLPPFLPNGYAGTVASSNPLNEASDPTQEIDAYTGDSRGILPDTDWIPVSINLGEQIGEFRNDLVVEAFDQTGFDDESTAVDQEGKVRTHTTWGVNGEDCPRCWQIENVAKGRPSLNGDDGPLFPGFDEFWWSGLRRPGTQTLDLDLSHEDSRFDTDVGEYQIWLTWWQFGTGTDPTLQPVEERGDWVRVETDITVRYRDAETQPGEFRWQFRPHAGSVRGWSITNPSLQAYELGGGGHRTLVASHSLGLDNDAIWDANGWTRTANLDAPDVWSVATDESHVEKLEEIWTFRDPTPNANQFHDTVPYADERLVTPVIDLTTVTGESAEVWYWNKGRAFAGDMNRIVEVQVLDRFSVPPTWGDWQRVTATAQAFNNQDWVQEGPIILDRDFIGQKIRLGFRAVTNEDTVVGSAQHPYNGWWIDDLEVRGDTMVGGPLRIRFHAGTDESVSASGWGIDNVEVVGRSYSDAGGNVAILLDDTSARKVAPGETLWINGTIRNLSPRIWVNLGVRAVADLPNGEHSLVPVEPEGLVNPDHPGVVGPLNLLPGGTLGSDGSLTDRLRFAYRFEVPETYDDDGDQIPLAGTDLGIRVEAMQFKGQNLLSIRDENLGDHRAQIAVEAADENLLEVASVGLSVLDPEIGEETSIRLTITNSGTLPATSDLGLSIRNVTSQEADQLDFKTVALAAAETQTVAWTWAPNRPGVYAVEYTNGADYLGEGQVPDVELAAYVFVNQSLTYFHDSLDDLSLIPDYDFDPTVWSREAGPAAVRACNNDLPTAGVTAWDPTDRAIFGDQSLVTAVEDEAFYGQGRTYPGNMDDRLYQPLLDLGHLVDTGRSGSPPVMDHVFLNFWFRPLVETGQDGLTVTTRIWNPEQSSFTNQFTLVPEDQTLWETIPCDNPIRAVATGMFTGQEEQWFRANFDLAQRNGIVGSQVQPTYRFGSDTAGHSQGIFLDSVSVSGYNARTQPELQTFTLTDNATKDFHIRITNEAPVRDRFHITVDSASTHLPPNVGKVEVLTPTLELAPGESGVAEIRVKTPLNRTLTTDGPFSITVLAVSEGDSNRAARGQISFEVFAPRLWPDLEATIDLAAAENIGSEGEPLSFLATVSNFGLATSRPTTYKVYACPAELASNGDCTTDDEHVIDEGTFAEIRPFIQTGRLDLSRVSITGTWTPPVGSAGEYVLVMVADPNKEATDYDRANNRFELPLTIEELALPDLRIVPESFRIETSDGAEIDRAIQGQLVRIRAVVENVGNAPAPSVRLQINAQFTLNSQQFSQIDPGDRVEVVANWVTLPGTWIIKAQATTSKAEFSLDNNALAKKLVVQRSDFSLQAESGEVRGKPGDAWEFPIHLRNTGEAPIEINVNAKTPAGFRPDIAPSQLSLDVFEAGQTLVRVTADEALEPGRYQVSIQASTTGVDLPLSSVVKIIVIESTSRAAVARDVFVEADSSGIAATLPVANQGSDPITARIIADAPAGWRVTPRPPQLSLAPGETGNFTLGVDIPRNFRPGEYVIHVRIDLPAGLQETTVSIVVPPAPAFDARVMRETSLSPTADTRVVLLRVENVGNVPAIPNVVLVDGDPTSRILIDPPLDTIQPGETRLHTVTLSGSDEAPAVNAIHVQGNPVASPTVAEPTTAKGSRGLDLLVADLAITPRHDVRSGDLVTVSATLANEGDTAGPAVPVGLYVDGLLVDQIDVVPTPDFHGRAEFRWRATLGVHVLMVVVDPFEELLENHRANNVVMASFAADDESGATQAVVIPGLDIPLTIFFAVGLVAFLRRRGRHAS